MPITTIYDTESQFSWDRKSTSYDFDGVIEFIGYVYDNGVSSISFYEFGTLSSIQITDAGADGGIATVGGVFNWTSRGTNYDENGVMTGRGTLYDNGVLFTEFFNRYGWLDRTIMSDDQDAKIWPSIFTDYDFGVIQQRDVIYDNGLSVTTRYHDGKVAAVDRYDLGDVKNWTTQSDRFDASGQREMIVTEFDTGVVHLEFWADGVKTNMFKADNGDVYNWTDKSSNFDVSGALTVEGITYDNGIVRLDFWADGARTSIEQRDTLDVKSWSEIVTTYDAAGLRDAKTTTFDSGIVRGEQWVDGQRASIEIQDTLDVKNWLSTTTNFDATGAISERVTVFDNGMERT